MAAAEVAAQMKAGNVVTNNRIIQNKLLPANDDKLIFWMEN